MFDNVQVITDNNENKKIDKEKSREKIDGMQALIMGISRASLYSGESVYENRGAIII
jgi:phage terminase large subunit-like protein